MGWISRVRGDISAPAVLALAWDERPHWEQDAPEHREGGMQLRVMLEPSEDGGYTVTVPSLPGCISEGDTRDEALANIREAIQLYLEPVENDTAGRGPAGAAELVEIAV